MPHKRKKEKKKKKPGKRPVNFINLFAQIQRQAKRTTTTTTTTTTMDATHHGCDPAVVRACDGGNVLALGIKLHAPHALRNARVVAVKRQAVTGNNARGGVDGVHKERAGERRELLACRVCAREGVHAAWHRVAWMETKEEGRGVEVRCLEGK